MFILQTTTAVLIAFLALLAYNEVQNRLAKGRSRKKDLESPGSPTILAAADEKHPVSQISGEEPTASSENTGIDKEMQAHKLLYHKLHNLEQYPEILPESRQLLLSLLSSTLEDALKEPASGILKVQEFTRKGLDNFLKAKDVDVTNRWEEYLNRRRSGGPREMFGGKEEAEWWLKQAAPVKYVDGAWLGHINKISTPFEYCHITKNAWQVMSEELGDGDLAKNHVHVYRDLMHDINAGLPAADSEDFIHPRHELNEARCWKAAMAQLIISLFPHDFLPEVLGFNMAYESLPLHLLKTVKELRELRLNPYYFELHISIDNADSGHAAMAMSAVADYIDLVRSHEGDDAAHCAWKRVQAGYILAEGLPTTPESPSLKSTPVESFPRNDLEASLLEIFAAKSFVAHKIHCNSRLKIGRRSLVDWLEPTAFKNTQWQKEFLHDLGNCKPWIIKGDSERSRLVKELSWEGKMFGSFTEKEVEVVKAWIDDLAAPTCVPDSKVYLEFTGRSSDFASLESSEGKDILADYPIVRDVTLPAFVAFDVDQKFVPLDLTKVNIKNFLPIWFTSSALLESLPSVPVRASDTFGSALIRALRAQTGFDIEGLGVAGMDEVRRTDSGKAIGIVELGHVMCRNAGLAAREHGSLKSVVALGSSKSREFSEWMVHASMRWLTNRDLLVGMAWAFMGLHEAVARFDGEDALLNAKCRVCLGEIAARERAGLEICMEELERDEQRLSDFNRGISIARAGLRAICQIEDEI
ncbi:hypothetical protein NX059_006885 [Plenodomus lindquistii]|nr:hypothetical protein NX059_006885 [Plenodomus lindquistii]